MAANDLVEVNRCRKLALLCPASRAAVAEFYIVTVRESLIRELHMDSWDGAKATLISFSKWRSRQDVGDAAVCLASRLNRKRRARRQRRRVRLERDEVVNVCGTSAD
jgi:hypothetical protein